MVAWNFFGIVLVFAISKLPQKFKISQWIRDWYVFLALPLIFKGLTPLSKMVFGRHFTENIASLEQKIFGSQPAFWLADKVDSPLLLDVLNLAYLSYFFIFVAIAVALYRKVDKDSFEHFKFAITFTFLANYIFYVFFPVEGPCWVYPEAALSTLNGYIFTDLVIGLQGGAVTAAAFPSSHVSLSIVSLLYAFKYTPTLARVLTPFVVLLVPSTFYGKFHFVLDAAAGLIWGFVMFYLTWKIWSGFNFRQMGFSTQLMRSES